MPACFSKKEGTIMFWPEGGVVNWVYKKTGKCGACDWRIAALRVLSISEMIKPFPNPLGYGDERVKLQRWICDMEKVIREARRQEAELDAKVKKAKVRVSDIPKLELPKGLKIEYSSDDNSLMTRGKIVKEESSKDE